MAFNAAEFQQPQAEEGYVYQTKMKRLGEDAQPFDPYRRQMMAQALASGPSNNASPMGSAMSGFARGMGQGAMMRPQGADAGKSAGLMGLINQLFGGAKGF